MKNNTRVLDISPSESQMLGMRDAHRFKTESDKDVDEFIAFMAGMRVPFGAEPLSYSHFDEFEQYLSAFYQSRIDMIRAKLKADIDFYKEAYIRESEKISKLKPPGKISMTTGGGPYPKGGLFTIPKNPRKKQVQKKAK